MDMRRLPGDPADGRSFSWSEMLGGGPRRRPAVRVRLVLLLVGALGVTLWLTHAGRARPVPTPAGAALWEERFSLVLRGFEEYTPEVEASLRGLAGACLRRGGPEADALLFCTLSLIRGQAARPRAALEAFAREVDGAAFPATAKLLARP